MRLVAHDQEVCGISIQNNRVASGGNDGSVFVWNLQSEKFIHANTLHSGAVKALSWCPWKTNLLASGGGSKDHRIVFLNT
jgi:WD40 repeat protein